MKRIRIMSGGRAGQGTDANALLYDGDYSAIIPSGSQITKVFIVPGTDEETGVTGTWVRINDQYPMYIVVPTILCRDDFGYCCPPVEKGIDGCGNPYMRTVDDTCDRYPGDVQISIDIGLPARPEGQVGRDFAIGGPAAQWFIMYEGG